ncbi:MAG: DUF3846 domain-containing protein [Bacteroidota bacterium]|nr:DUF3846 domain-containing protein [Bacteroidota bacterium]
MENNFGLQYKANGEIRKARPNNGMDFSLAELQAFVGGHIDIIPLKAFPELVLVCNDEGRINGLSHNVAGSLYYGASIFGDVLICRRNLIK